MADKTPDEPIHYIDQIGLIALRNRLNPDEASWFRRLCREFSILFHTPLVEVEKLNLEYILLHLKEHEYSKAEEVTLRRLKHNLVNNIEANRFKDDEEWEAEQEFEALKQEQEDIARKNMEVLKKEKEMPPDIKLDF